VSQQKKIRVALVGAGYVSAHHLKALKLVDGVEVVGIADLDFDRAQQVAARFGVPKAFRTLAEMASVSPEVIHILTPPGSHANIAIEALNMGCHVFVEKPMAENPADCERMIAAAEAAGRILSVNHSARMDPIVLQAMELISSGAIGTVLGVDFFRSSDYPQYSGGPNIPPQFRKGSYPMQDLGVHGLTIFESFLGKVQSVDTLFNSTGADTNLLFDEWRALAHCERGKGQMYLSWNVRPIRSEAIVHGTRGILRLDFFLQTISAVRTMPGPKFLGSVVSALTNAVKTLWQVPANVVRFATGKLSGAPGIHISIRKFYEALQQGTPVPIPASEGRRIISVIDDVCNDADARKVLYRQEQLRPLPSADILVTGAGGFLGRTLVNRLLKNGETVRVTLRRRIAEWENNPQIQMLCGDLGDPGFVDHAIDGVSTVFHVGAAMKGGKEDFERGTIWGTRNVIDSCLRHGVRRVVYVSSLSVLDHAGHDPRKPVVESSPYEPYAERRGLYTQTKLQAEHMVLDAVRDRNLPAVILRPGQIFGPGGEHFAPSGTISLAGRWVVVGGGYARLPLVFVEDVVDALLLARQNPSVVGAAFNIVDAEKVNQRQYIAAYAQNPKSKVRVLYVPYSVMFFGGYLCDLLGKVLKRGLPLSRYRVRSIRPLSPFDLTAAEKTLGWKPSCGTTRGMQISFSRAVPSAPAASALKPVQATESEEDSQALVGSRESRSR
jgi:2-alkyl-3-oxoalkanoate reductase